LTVRYFSGAWWYGACLTSNLNGFWYPASSSDANNNAPNSKGVVWREWRGFQYSLKATTMKVTRS